MYLQCRSGLELSSHWVDSTQPKNLWKSGKNKLELFLHPTLKLLNQRPFSIGTYSCNALLVTLPKSCFYSTWHWKVTGNYQRFAPPFFVNELSMMLALTDYGHPERVLFWKSQTFGLGLTNWATIFGALWVFWADLWAPILVLWVSCPCFPLGAVHKLSLHRRSKILTFLKLYTIGNVNEGG